MLRGWSVVSYPWFVVRCGCIYVNAWWTGFGPGVGRMKDWKLFGLGRCICKSVGVFPRCAKLLPWVLRICGRAEGGVRSGEGGNKEVLVREVSSSDFCTFVWGVLERKYLALVDFFVLHG